MEFFNRIGRFLPLIENLWASAFTISSTALQKPVKGMVSANTTKYCWYMCCNYPYFRFKKFIKIKNLTAGFDSASGHQFHGFNPKLSPRITANTDSHSLRSRTPFAASFRFDDPASCRYARVKRHVGVYGTRWVFRYRRA